MTVLVKGMKMPQSCYYCGLSDTSFINCVAFEKSIVLEDDCEERRPDWCPLDEFPDKHGRLVDADEIMNDICNSINQMTKIGIAVDGNYLWGKLNDALDNAPTIIEAEGES
jgi:hypothetical protein